MKGSNSKGTSDMVRQNLLDAKAKLVSQEAELLSKLDQIRKGIEGIETTIQVVGDAAPSAEAPKTRKPRAKAAEKAAAKTTEKAPRTPRKPRTPRAAKESAPAAKTPAKTAAKTASPTVKTATAPAKAPAKAKGPAKGKAPAKARAPKETATAPAAAPAPKKERKSAKEDAGWQTFMMDEFKGKPLTEVVEVVFNRSPQALMGSNELISQIFSEDIPKKERTSARDRLLNILSIGVNEKKWYRAKPGQYTLTKGSAAKGK